MSALATTARIAIPLIIGAIAGYNLRAEEEHDDAMARIDRGDPEDLAALMQEEGLRLITSDEIPEAGTDIGGYITSLYRGLFLVGRTGAQLSGAQRDSIAMKLRHLHHQFKPRRDRFLVSWYETVGVSQPADYVELLADCPLSEMFDGRYIAFAMSQQTEDLDFSGLAAEAAKHFRA